MLGNQKIPNAPINELIILLDDDARDARSSVSILGEHDLAHQTTRAMIERINPVTRTHAFTL